MIFPMQTQTDLRWHIVCGRFELEELVENGVITSHNYTNNRQQLFLTMKYPTQNFYQGGWGPEILYYDKEDNWTTGQLGRVWATDARAEEISIWIRNKMFRV